MAEENFSSIKDKGLKEPDYVDHLMYDESTLGHLLKIIPNKDVKNLTITWPQMPDRRHLWNGKPANYITHCIGHEGKYSLKSELIKQGLVTSCDAICATRLYSCTSSIAITMNLTDKGVD